MSISMVFSCDGCFKTAPAVSIKREFESLNGRGWGFGRYVVHSDPESLAPEGWTAFCIVGCTYCPECTAEIDGAVKSASEVGHG